MKQSDEIQATTVVATGMENLKSYGERDRGVYKIPHFYVQNRSEVELLHCTRHGGYSVFFARIVARKGEPAERSGYI